MNSPKPRRPKLVRIAIWVIGFFVFVELALQIVAYVAWSNRRSGEVRGDGDGPVVLCVGDSMTFGLGATTGNSYPSQLERKLRERDGRAWVVVNGGYPGRDSQGVLDLLPDQLERYRPEFVFVLVGTNDQWSQPGMTRRIDASDSFPIVWRTGRLIDILMVGRLAEHGEGAFVGVWHKDGVEVHFQPTGRMLYAGAELRWETDGSTLNVVMPDGQVVHVDWRIEDGKLRLESEIWDEVQMLEPGPVTDLTPVQRGRRAAAVEDWDAAMTAFEAGIATDERWHAEEGIVQVLLATSRPKEAASRVASMAAELASDPIPRMAGESLAHAQIAIGEIDAAIATADRVLDAHPESDRAWEIMVKHAVERGRTDEVVAAIDRALPKLIDGGEWRPNLLVQRGLLVRESQPAVFVRNLFEGLRAGAPEKHVINHIRLARHLVDDAMLERAIADLGAQPDEAKRWREIFRRGLESQDDLSTVLVEHLAAIVDTCKQAGAEPLLLDYPFRDLDHEKLVDSVAAAKGVRRVPLRPKFDELLESLTRDDLFIRDDVHCNDRGYGVMADLAADALLR
ncbi:MAG: hypothetical protein KDB80_10870 [Planctomycetes bacterium]|nr:hypothetical protein [Planctomycetota bacterium]